MQIKEAERANRKNKQQKLRQLILWVSCMFVIFYNLPRRVTMVLYGAQGSSGSSPLGRADSLPTLRVRSHGTGDCEVPTPG